MAGGLDTSCLYSTVKNTSGKRLTFGFLPPHGRTLAAGEEFTVFGDITQAVIRHERTEGRRNIVALEKALVTNKLEIISTPAVVLKDDSNPGSTKTLRLRNGVLGVQDPCWNTSSSEDTLYG